MAGFNEADAKLARGYQQNFPNMPLERIAQLTGIPRADLDNYAINKVGTPATNSAFGQVTSARATTTQNETVTPRNSAGSGSAFTGVALPAQTVTSPASTETVTNTTGSGSAFQGGGTIASQAFGDRTPAPVASPPVPTPRPPRVQDSDVDFTDAYGEDFRQATPIPAPVVQPTDTDVDFDDAYGESFRTVTPIPPSTRLPGVAQTPPGIDAFGGPGGTTSPQPDPATLPSGSRGGGDFLDDRGRAATPQPDPFPEPPPGRPAQPISQVDDFGGTGITPVDDFGGPSRNITPVDDFGAYTNNDFGQVDDFAEINTPAQVDDFCAYTNNDFGAQVDDFGDPTRNPAQVDDFSAYTNNDFGAQVDDFGDQPRNAPFVDDFGEYGTRINDETQFDDFGDPIVSSQAQFGVDSFGEYGTRINDETQFDDFGDPIIPEGKINDGESLVGDDPTGEVEEFAGIDGVEQAAISNAQTQAINAQALKTKAQNQQTINEMREASGVKNADGDWRVKLRLAPQADYLYKALEPGILAPLAVTDGIIFPYTPTIDVQYRAEYQNYQPTHSNYMHYFYKGSSVQTVQLQADFTAQDTKEAEYLLACMHFLKSASKMFYGQDAQRGSPPPLLYLSGLGEYQFNEQPCVVSEFNLNLPSDVNYIRARSRHINRDDQLQFEKPLATATTNGNFSALNRLRTAVTNALNGSPEPLQVGAKPFTPSPGNLGSKGATYVPTKMSMTINLLPIASRQQVSQQFSLKEYANGNLIKKGMW